MTGSPLVSTAWVARHQRDPDLRILDASWYLPSSGRDARAEFLAGHIPGAQFCDLDRVSDQTDPLPHMLPTAKSFAQSMGELGLNDRDLVVVYDGSGVNLSAARLWWMFLVFGHSRVAVLDGGLGKWRAEGRPLETGEATASPGEFTAHLDGALVRDLDAVRRNLERRKEQVVDARSAGRFKGTEPEPRAGLRGGHLPGSLNLPFDQMVAPDGTVLSQERLRARFEAAGLDLHRPVVATCGSGTSACALILGLRLLGHTDNAVYDGSWTEWGASADLPIETGHPGGEGHRE